MDIYYSNGNPNDRIILQSDTVDFVGTLMESSNGSFNDKSTVSFLYQNCDVQKANNLRRRILRDVRSYAIDQITIMKNTTELKDENLALIFGLLVINNSELLNQYSYLQKFDDNLQIDMTFASEDSTDSELRSIKGMFIVNKLTTVSTTDVKVIPFADNFDIVKLRKNQELSCSVQISAGTGHQHAKWSPVSTVFFHPTSEKSAICNYKFTLELIGNLTIDLILNQLGFIREIKSIKSNHSSNDFIITKNLLQKDMHHAWLHNYV